MWGMGGAGAVQRAFRNLEKATQRLRRDRRRGRPRAGPRRARPAGPVLHATPRRRRRRRADRTALWVLGMAVAMFALWLASVALRSGWPG